MLEYVGVCVYEATVLSQIMFLTGTAAGIASAKAISPTIPIPREVCAGAQIQKKSTKFHKWFTINAP